MCNYQLDELLLAAICAVISGAESWTLVVEWSEMKLDWLRQQLPFANGIASHDTFGRVFSLLDAKQFEACFMLWIGELCPSLDGHHIAIDGKCVRGSRDGACGAIHLVSAWSSASGLGAVITIDAMGCQHGIAAKIVARDGLCPGREGQPARPGRGGQPYAGKMDRPF